MTPILWRRPDQPTGSRDCEATVQGGQPRRAPRLERSSGGGKPADEARNVERAEAVMVQPADIGLEEGAQIGHAVFQHGDAIDPHTPGEALVLVRIEPAIAQ